MEVVEQDGMAEPVQVFQALHVLVRQLYPRLGILAENTLMGVPLASVLLTSNIVKVFTKISSSSGVKLLQCYVLRATQGGDDVSAFGGDMISPVAG